MLFQPFATPSLQLANRVVMAWPPPMHSVTTPRLQPARSSAIRTFQWSAVGGIKLKPIGQ
jgi:2,4-dienoyl-CoA reductase-like NADH-dependent reductase (Old Yellow Enzyme family)